MNYGIDPSTFEIPFKVNNYEFRELIGAGAYGWVFKAVNLIHGHEFAAKIIYCDKTKLKLLKSIQSEFDCLMSLYHPNIIKVYDKFKKGDYLFLMLELCEGSINKFIDENKKLTEYQILLAMKQLLKAIQYCHSKGIAHRDIKPANILTSDYGVLKLGDFGLGLKIKENENIAKYDGTLRFKAPELLKKVKHDPFKADIWSLGVTFYFIATGTYPWGSNPDYLKENILLANFTIPRSVPSSISKIIKQMLVINPLKRASADQLLENEIFNSINERSPLIVKQTENRIPLAVKTMTFPKARAYKGYKSVISRSAMTFLNSSFKKSVLKAANA